MGRFKPSKPKAGVKAKAEREAEAKRETETKRKRGIAEFKLYPLLVEVSDSVEEAQMHCQVLSAAIGQAFNNRRRLTKVSDLKLEEALNESVDKSQKYRRALEIFKDENVTDSLEIIEGMNGVIGSFVREEMSKRKLDTLKAEFLQ